MRLASRFTLLATSLLLFVILVSFIQSHAAEVTSQPVGVSSTTGLPCSNPRPATQNDVDAHEDKIKLGDPICPRDEQTVAPDSGRAKRELDSMWCGDRAPRCGPYQTDVNQLNPQFSICAQRFLEAVRKKDPSICMVSAFRSTAHQGYLCSGGCGRVNGPCAAAGNSKHQQGLAIDIVKKGFNTLPGWVHAMAQGYGVRFPVRNDDGHFEPTPGFNCADPNFRPTDTARNMTPSSGLTNALRGIVSPAQPFAQQPPPQQMCALPDGNFVPCSAIANPGGSMTPGAITPTSPSAPPPIGTQNTTPYTSGTCAPQFYCQNNNLYYRTSTCVDQLNQICPSGCSGTSCVGSQPVSDILGGILSNTSGTQTTPNTTSTPTSSLSVFEQIMLLANPEPVGTAATTVPLVLTIDAGESARLQGTPPPPGTPILPQDTYTLAPSGSQQTFTSSDLQNSMPYEFTGSQTTLSIMREALVRILAYLRPFGRPSPQGYGYNEFGEHAE